MIDYLIIGQGIGGTALSYYLLNYGKKIKVIDPGGMNATRVAAGNINPLTGRSFTKSWLIDELLEEAKTFYQGLSEQIGEETVRSTAIYRTIRTVKEENKWMGRINQPEYATYINDIEEDIPEKSLYQQAPMGFGKVSNALQVDTNTVIEGWRQVLLTKGCLIEERLEYNQLSFQLGHINYKGLKAKQIIFAEGRAIVDNPYFNYLPIEPTKGEALLVTLHQQFDKNIKDNVFISPIKDRYWVGSGYEWEFDTDLPTVEGREKLEQKLTKSIGTSYDVKDHLSGIRPCVKDRRPLIGRHPEHSNVYVFNGLGTKGTSLGPYFANQLVHHIEQGTPILSSADIKRYQSLYPI